MNTSGIGSNPFTLAITSYNLAQPISVGEESAEDKTSRLPPVEQSASAAPSQTNDSADQGPDAKGSASDAFLQQQEVLELSNLKKRDREVRSHEQAHAAVGGQFAGSPSYQFSRGSDGRLYAVSGEVPISLPRYPGDPEATLRAAEQVRAAALAPAQPSAQDQRIAAAASALALEARAQIADQQRQAVAAERSAQDSKSKTEDSSDSSFSENNTETAAASPTDRTPLDQLTALDRQPESGSLINDLA